MTDVNPNREIFDRNYDPHLLEREPESRWDCHLVDLRMGLIREFGTGKDVLDLCCGTGTYLLPNLHRFRSAVAVDFSGTMLTALRERLDPALREGVTILEENVEELSVPDESVDFVWSYTALYYVPALDRALRHVARVLRPGGYAALELGNSRSLNSLVSRVQYQQAGWARPYFRPYGELRRLLADAGLPTVRWHSFQLLNTYGAPRPLIVLSPLLSPRWKPLLGRELGGRVVDEWISGVWPLRHLAFRHLAVVRKP